jgi:hypothetical protein
MNFYIKYGIFFAMILTTYIKKKENIMKMKIILAALLAVIFTGCGVGSLVALPFKAVGAVTDVVAPEAVGDTIRGVGEAADTVIPF